MSGQRHSNVTQHSECRVSTNIESGGQGYGCVGQSHEVIPDRKHPGPSVGFRHTRGSSAVWCREEGRGEDGERERRIRESRFQKTAKVAREAEDLPLHWI